MLADESVYLAIESTFCRVLKAHGQTAHHGHAKAPGANKPPTTHIAHQAAPSVVIGHDLPALFCGRETKTIYEHGLTNYSKVIDLRVGRLHKAGNENSARQMLVQQYR